MGDYSQPYFSLNADILKLEDRVLPNMTVPPSELMRRSLVTRNDNKRLKQGWRGLKLKERSAKTPYFIHKIFVTRSGFAIT
jgi:hypothetical protein